MWICIHNFSKSMCACRPTVILGTVQMKFSATNENDNQEHLIPYVHTKQSNSFHTAFSYTFFYSKSFIYVNICPKHSTQSWVFFNTVTSCHIITSHIHQNNRKNRFSLRNCRGVSLPSTQYRHLHYNMHLMTWPIRISQKSFLENSYYYH